MLRGLNKASSTWLGKAVMAVVMGFLVISFVVWGIGDIFRGFGVNAVATIGGTEISIEQFRQFYNERLQQLDGRSAGRPPTKHARALTDSCWDNSSLKRPRSAGQAFSASAFRRRYC